MGDLICLLATVRTLKIPRTIVLRIVKMLQNMEYPTLPLIKTYKFWQHFWAENILKVPTKGKGISVDSMQIIYFTWKYIHMKYE